LNTVIFGWACNKQAIFLAFLENQNFTGKFHPRKKAKEGSKISTGFWQDFWNPDL
jgi:imidazoleglycerol phosphate synthase glutamine amidotransferase subunit HisH